MAKLKDDQIRWVLSLDAKGVQGELVQVSSSINRLKSENADLGKEMKKAERAMNDAEKAMIRLEDAGKINTKQYERAKISYDQNAVALKELTDKVSGNNRTIDEEKAKYDQLYKTLKVGDMTMSQLKKRASELQEQLDNTSLAADPEAYAALQKELGELNNRIGIVRSANKNLLQQFASIPGPVGSAVKSVQGLGMALKALIANPVGVVIMAIVAALYALKTAIAGSDEASTKFSGVMKAMGSVLDTLKRMVTEVVAAFVNLVTLNFDALKENVKALKELGSSMAGNAKAAYDATLAEDALNDAIARNNDITTVNKARLEELRLITQDTTKSIEERKKASDELLKIEKENYKMAVENVAGAYKVFEGQNKNLIDAMKRGSKDQFEQVEKYMQLVQEGTELTYQQRLELAELVNDITATLDKGTEEEKEKFRSFFADLSSMQQEYFAGSRRDQKRAASLRNEAVSAANKAREEQLKQIDKSLKLEINQLKQARLEGLKTEKEYNDEVEKLTMAALEKKKAIKGQEKSALIEYDAQILDAQLKQQTEADKILLDSLTKEHQKQLSMLDSQRNYKLEKLQEEESDQKIYALRAAEIEAETAKAREDVIRAFGQTLEQAEFNNNQTRLDSIQKNGEDIIKADSETLKQQANLRKLFARTTADFERQYNIKTWEQRKEDELRILEKQHAENLISEETYQLALIAIEKKYQDEKLKVRQQYGLVGMAETYQLELDALQEQLDKKLISEEDFERAKLAIKLKYASELAQKSGEFANAGANAVKSIEEAETAKLDAEYTKRQSALTEQYNAGIISQEEFNAKKEELDYEQKSKELEIEKKFADANFAMQAAQIVASTAQGIITAWSTSMQLGPIAGPIAAAAMTALLGITSIAQLAKAKAERDRVKAMTLEAPGGGGSSAPKTGEIRLRQGFAEGGLNNDLTSGGYTGTGGKYDVAGYVPIHSGEYVIARDELQQPEIMNMARAIESVRRQRTNKNPTPAGFADGGSNTSGGNASAMAMVDNKTVSRLVSVLDRLQNGDIVIQTNYGITELEAEQKRKIQAESKFTKYGNKNT